MDRQRLIEVIKLACIPGIHYPIEVIGQYVAISYNAPLSEVKSAILGMLQAEILKLTDDFKITLDKTD